jgi:hypothetical protein
MNRCPHALRVEHCTPCLAAHLVGELATAVDWLTASVLPGTGRAWLPPAHYEDRRTPEQREQARLEREQRIDIAPGEAPVPFDVDVLDLLSTVLVEADDLAERVAVACWRPIDPPATSAFADAGRPVALVAQLLPVVQDRDLLEHIADHVSVLVDKAQHVLGLTFDGQLLDATCPWCKGRTSHHPEGGRRTLRIRTGKPEANPKAGQPGEPDEHPARTLVVCEGGACEPGDQSGQRWRGLPAWDLLNEGEWLRRCIDIADKATTCRCGQPVLRTGKAGRPKAHCSERCRRDADAERQRQARQAC